MHTRSDKRQAQEQLYRIQAKIYLGLHPECEACRYLPANQIHHKVGKEGIWLNVVELFMAVCPQCQRFIHDHPHLAYERGWMLLRATRGRYMKDSTNYNPFDYLRQRLQEIDGNAFVITCSARFGIAITKEVRGRGGVVNWHSGIVGVVLQIIDNGQEFPGIRIDHKLPGDAFVIRRVDNKQ